MNNNYLIITDNVKKILKSIPNNVILVAATKTRSPDEILAAVNAGIKIIGENYVQEAESKFALLNGKVKIHLIGHLQTNKVKIAVEIFDMIQSVDGIKLADEINKHIKKIMPVLIEVKFGDEDTKTGCSLSNLSDLIAHVKTLKNLDLQGLMCIPPVGIDPIPIFRKMKALKEKYNFNILSMGMSDDYKVAIVEGSDIVRLGTILFGKRDLRQI